MHSFCKNSVTYRCVLLLMSFPFAGTFLKMDKRFTLFVYLMSDGVPYVSCVAVKFCFPLSEEEFSNFQFVELPTKPADVVCAATTFNLKFSTDEKLSLISTYVVLNVLKLTAYYSTTYCLRLEASRNLSSANYLKSRLLFLTI